MSQKYNGVLHNRIAVLRAEKGWTQKEVADRLGVSRQTVISMEKNKYTPSLILAFELAELFEKNVNEVFQYDTNKERDD